MKKIVLIFMLMFSIIVVRAEEVNVKLEWVPNVYINYEKDGVKYWGQFAYIYVNETLAYCLEISKSVNTTSYTKTNEKQENNLVVLAGYFGYGYEGKDSLKDYMATQKLIWEYLGTPVYFTTQSNGKGVEIDVRDNELKIVRNINRYAIFPSYEGDLKFNIGTTNNVLQSNTIVKDYNIINKTSNNIEFYDKGIIFNANEVGSNIFYLETKYTKKHDNIIYVADNSQKVMVIGNVNNLKSKYSYQVLGATLNINVILNNESLNRKGVINNVFKIYDSANNLIGIYKPDASGSIVIENLNLGNYKIKHTEITEGYKKEIEEYDILIDNNNLNVKKEIILNQKTINITINKYYTNPILNTIYKDDGVIYTLYNKNDELVKELVTNEDGSAVFNLKYGNYKLVQSNTSNIDIYHEDILIETNDFESDKIYNIEDIIYKAKIKVNVLDKEDNTGINGAKFKINDKIYVTNEGGTVITDFVDLGIYKFNEFNVEEYEKINDFEFKITENSEFYIENNEAYIDLNIYLEKKNIIKDEPEQDKNIETSDNLEDSDIKGKNDNLIGNNKNDEYEEKLELNNNINSNIENKEQEEVINIEENDKNEKENIGIYETNKIINKLPFLGDDTYFFNYFKDISSNIIKLKSFWLYKI